MSKSIETIGLKNISIDFLNNEIQHLFAVQGDTKTRGLLVRIKDNNGNTIPASTEYELRLYAKYTDEAKLLYSVADIVDEQYRVYLTTDMLRKVGTLIIQLALYKDNVELIQSKQSSLQVHPSMTCQIDLGEDKVIDIIKMQESLDGFEEKLDKLKNFDEFDGLDSLTDFKKSETTRQEAETKRVQAEEQRVVEETNRVSNEQSRVENEKQRVADEEVRKSNEDIRKANEQARVEKDTANDDIMKELTNASEYLMEWRDFEFLLTRNQKARCPTLKYEGKDKNKIFTLKKGDNKLHYVELNKFDKDVDFLLLRLKNGKYEFVDCMTDIFDEMRNLRQKEDNTISAIKRLDLYYARCLNVEIEPTENNMTYTFGRLLICGLEIKEKGHDKADKTEMSDLQKDILVGYLTSKDVDIQKIAFTNKGIGKAIYRYLELTNQTENVDRSELESCESLLAIFGNAEVLEKLPTAILTSEAAINYIAKSRRYIVAILNSSSAMNKIVNSNTAMNILVNNETAMNYIIKNRKATDIIAKKALDDTNFATNFYNQVKKNNIYKLISITNSNEDGLHDRFNNISPRQFVIANLGRYSKEQSCIHKLILSNGDAYEKAFIDRGNLNNWANFIMFSGQQHEEEGNDYDGYALYELVE